MMYWPIKEIADAGKSTSYLTIVAREDKIAALSGLTKLNPAIVNVGIITSWFKSL